MIKPCSVFLSTPSARRATADHSAYLAGAIFLSTPSARRATTLLRRQSERRCISIHALCEEGDSIFGSPTIQTSEFLSTPSARRATGHQRHGLPCVRISIHALCEEGDASTPTPNPRPTRFLSTPSARRATVCFSGLLAHIENFYPRPLRGGRPVMFCDIYGDGKFLSTPSARRATLFPSC